MPPQKQDAGDESGVIYLGHIPKGFAEDQMKKYFKQFGRIEKLRLARSKKTGNPKGYAFIQFHSPVVARIVAETMNNYLMFHKLLKCQYLPMTKVHPKTFVGGNRHFKKPKAHVIAMQRHNREKTDAQRKKSLQKMKAKNAKTTAVLASMGIDYEFTLPGEKPGQKEADDTGDSADDSVDKKPSAEELEMLQQEALHVLYDDSEEEEIEFKTPPRTVRRRSSMYKPSDEHVAVPKDSKANTRGKRKLKSADKTQKRAKK